MSGAFEGLPEQAEARRLLEAALERPGHAYLLSGPEGSGKRAYADRFAAALLASDLPRIEHRTHPDLFVLEPEGSGILMDAARRLRRDLHLRPFEAARRVYLILDAHLLREEAANGLLKSLEEPPAYGVFVLVSDHAGRMLPTVLSRLAVVPFRRFGVAVLAAHTGSAEAARAAGGSLRRAEQLARDPAAAARRDAYRELARASLLDPSFDPHAAAADVLEAANRCAKQEAAAVAAALATALASVDDAKDQRALTRRFEERGKRAARRAEWDELRTAVDTIAEWYRERLARGLGAGAAVVNLSPPGEEAEDGAEATVAQALKALSAVSDVRRSLELNVHPGLALEAMFHRLAWAAVETVEL